MSEFRFQDLEIWKRAVTLAETLFDVADQLDKKRLFRFAEQLRGAALSIPNNIAEGSGSNSKQEFRQFLNFARRSVFEVANMMYIFHDRRLISDKTRVFVLCELEQLARMITGFRRSLR